MSYTAIVCQLTNVRKHPNADRLMLATVQGYQIIVGLDAKEGDLGVFFPCDGALSKEHLLANKLYATNPDTGEKMGGYFGLTGRVKAQRFRGQISDGFWQPVSAFNWCGGLNLKDGTEFDTLNGHLICQKYFTPATLKVLNRSRNKKITVKVCYPLFHEHYDTQQLRHNVNSIPEGSVIFVSEKMHGTSGRTSLTLPDTKRGKIVNFFRKLFGLTEQWAYVSGTRRVILRRGRDGYYGSDTFRQRVHEKIARIGLNKGETLYYEIVGYTDDGRGLMPTYDLSDAKMQKRYGAKMSYSYGCNPGESDFYVYRITQLTPDNRIIELSWNQIQARCR